MEKMNPKYLQEIEKKLIYHDYLLSDGSTQLIDKDEVGQFLQWVCIGSYVEALKSPFARNLIDLTTVTSISALTEIFEEKLSGGDKEVQLSYIALGICFLYLFIQNNFTGPQTTQISLACLEEEKLEIIVEEKENIYSLLKTPHYLMLSKLLLVDLKKLFRDCTSIHWWCMRCCTVIQNVCDERLPSIYETLLQSINLIENASDFFSLFERDLKALFHLECIYIHIFYYDIGRARENLKFAKDILGMKMCTAGALGKRTKYQIRDLPQLFLKVEFEDKTICVGDSDNGQVLLSTDLPKDLNLNDDTRLEKINFKECDEDIIPNFRSIEQAIIIADLVVKRRSEAQDITLNEESKAYIWALVQNPKNWTIQKTTLYLRSLIESTESRAMERSMNQVEEITKSIRREEPSRFERSKLFFGNLILPDWEIQQELAKMFMSLGCIKTALEIFESLHLWEDMITCYNGLQMRQKSAKIIREQMENKETPKLWCLLGDATDDIQCYIKAWEMSNGKSFRAQRSLGNYYYDRKEYMKAIPYYEKSVDLNHLQFPTWQRLAYCALQVEKWELCATAYRRCSVLEPDSFECWNNMSQAYIKLDQKERAWKTLQEALRCRSDSWRLWDNYMLVSTSLGHISQALHAYKTILSLKEKHVDIEILSRIVIFIIEEASQVESLDNILVKKLSQEKKMLDKMTANEERKNAPSIVHLKNIHKTCSQLLAKLSREVPTNSELWYLYGDITAVTPEISKETMYNAMIYYRKSIAAETQKPGWEKNGKICNSVLHKSNKLVIVAELVVEGLDRKVALAELSSIKMCIKNVVTMTKRGQTSIATGQLTDHVLDVLPSTENHLADIQKRLNALSSDS